MFSFDFVQFLNLYNILKIQAVLTSNVTSYLSMSWINVLMKLKFKKKFTQLERSKPIFGKYIKKREFGLNFRISF